MDPRPAARPGRPGRLPRLSRRLLLLTAVAVPLLLLSAYVVSGGAGLGSSEDSLSGGSDVGASVEPAEAESAGGGRSGSRTQTTSDASGDVVTGALLDRRAVISTATVSLRTDDVVAARFTVQRLVDELRGEVTEEETYAAEGTEPDDIRVSRLVVRVPSSDFDTAVSRLEEVGELDSSTRASEDVTTEVIDVEARIRAQEQSLARVEVLFARATSIRDVVAIEAQLTRRQAALDSLKQQQAFLADQTALSTITVHLQQSGPGLTEPDDGPAGFLAGLADGWHALGVVVTGTATAVGAVLPFAGLVLLLGTPAWLALRRRTRRTTRPAAAPSST